MNLLNRKLNLLVLMSVLCNAVPAATRADLIRQKLDDPAAGVFIVAHRGCHNPSPRLALPAVPENSRPALEHCVLLGVDMMELDVRRSRDGALVVIHDATVDRTTNGRGKVSELTLEQLKSLRLKQNYGGEMWPEAGNEKIATLAEMLDLARDRIMLNLDIKEDDIYAQTIAEANAHGMARHVLVKSFVHGDAAGAAADEPKFAGVPYMPIVGPRTGSKLDLERIAVRELAAHHRPVGMELLFVPQPQYLPLQKLAAREKVRLWANTLTQGGVVSVIGMGGDIDGLRTAGKAWGDLIASGINTIQTDEPGPLLDYLERAGIKR